MFICFLNTLRFFSRKYWERGRGQLKKAERAETGTSGSGRAHFRGTVKFRQIRRPWERIWKVTLLALQMSLRSSGCGREAHPQKTTEGGPFLCLFPKQPTLSLQRIACLLEDGNQ